MIAIKKFDGQCWLCGSLADSGEHRHKKSDVKRGFTNVLDNIENVAILGNDSGLYEIQGPNSKKLKFENVICQKCNTSNTQSFDLAYEIFINYILNNIDLLLKERKIDFNAIFPTDTVQQKKNVIKYYIKHFGCRLAENDISIDSSLVDYMNLDAKDLEVLYIGFKVDYSLYVLLDKFRRERFLYSNLYKGSMDYTVDLDNDTRIKSLNTFYTNEWFKVYFLYTDTFNRSKLNAYYDDLITRIEIEGENINPDHVYDMSLDDIIRLLTH